MAVQPQTYDYLNRAWKSACKVLFGEEIGELEDYREWLEEYITRPQVAKSAVSGKPVSLAAQDYARGARFIGFEEIDFGKKFAPLSMNDIKDIDSIVQAVQERLLYTGNIILGNSKFVENSANVVDSHFVYDSSVVSDSKYVALSHMVRKCSYMFGVQGDAESEFIFKCSDNHKAKRCFECYTAISCSDCYYSMHPQDCHELLFCFGSRSKSYCVGNLPLPKEKYLPLKAKLLFELREKLKKEKRAFSLLEVVQEARRHPPEIRIPVAGAEEKGDVRPVEEAFSRTSSLLLGRELSGIDSYASFLTKHVRQRLTFKSPISGKKAYLSSYMANLAGLYNIKGSFVPEEELVEIGKIAIGAEKAGSLRMDAPALAELLHPIAYSAMCDVIGTNRNLIDCAIVGYSEDCYKTDACVYSKKCGYSFWPRESEHIFGGSMVWESSFCMKAYQSKKLIRCFEADMCESCADLYFSHNCENVNGSMFCFNAKNLRNAVGNAEMGKEEYRKLKSAVQEQVAGELERKKTIPWDIYSLGAKD